MAGGSWSQTGRIVLGRLFIHWDGANPVRFTAFARQDSAEQKVVVKIIRRIRNQVADRRILLAAAVQDVVSRNDVLLAFGLTGAIEPGAATR